MGPRPSGATGSCEKAYSSGLTGLRERDVHTGSNATRFPSISTPKRGERSKGRHQSAGFGRFTALGCGITIGQS